jgi:hypothetical protein
MTRTRKQMILQIIGDPKPCHQPAGEEHKIMIHLSFSRACIQNELYIPVLLQMSTFLTVDLVSRFFSLYMTKRSMFGGFKEKSKLLETTESCRKYYWFTLEQSIWGSEPSKNRFVVLVRQATGWRNRFIGIDSWAP